MIIVIIHITLIEEHIADFIAATQQNIPLRRSAPGNLKVEVYQQQSAPTEFVMIEVFESQAAIDAYYATDAHKAWEAAVEPLWKEMRGADYTAIE